MSWVPALLTWLPRIMMIIMGAIGAYYMWQWGSAITTGVQQAAPGLGTAVAALGMILAMMPLFMMMMFITMLMTTFMSLVR